MKYMWERIITIFLLFLAMWVYHFYNYYEYFVQKNKINRGIIINEDIDITVGSILQNNKWENIIVAKIHEWDSYFDLEVIHKESWAAGSIRVYKK